jgi:hypothetical protein
MSTALSTEMPTSAACSAGASLMPSPMKPTTWPPARSARTTRSLSCGARRANTLCCCTACASAASSSARNAAPSIRPCTGRPTWRQTSRVTRSLSPVSTFTATPRAASACSAGAALSLGGSRKATKPTSVRPASSAA